MFGTQSVVLFGEPRGRRVVPAGSDVGAAFVHPIGYRAGAQDGTMSPRLAGHISVGAVALRNRPQDCEDVPGGEQANPLGVIRHRALQLLLGILLRFD